MTILEPWQKIITDILDIHNDYIEIYFKENKDGTITYSDDSFTICSADLCGMFVPVSGNKYKKIFDKILKKYNVILRKNELMTRGDINAKNNLLSAIQEINEICKNHIEGR